MMNGERRLRFLSNSLSQAGRLFYIILCIAVPVEGNCRREENVSILYGKLASRGGIP